MKKLWESGWTVVLAVVVAVAVTMLFNSRPPAFGKAAGDAKSTGGPRCTVIETQGFNLLVTDNEANKLYYYATDKDAPVGSPLKLRASLDLTDVGKDEIKIKPINLENMRKKDDKEK